MKTKIYLFNNSGEEGIRHQWCVCYAMADTGEVLATHICSHPAYMPGDLHDHRPERQVAWAKKYPEGYEIVVLANAKDLPDEVYKKNQALGEDATKDAELAGVSMTLTSEATQ